MTTRRTPWLSGLLTLAMALTASTAALAQQRVLRIISDRTDQGTLRPMLEAFEAKSGAKVTGVFLDQGLVNRLESRPTEADVVITKDAELLELAAERGLLSPFKSAAISASIPPEFMDPQGRFFVDAYRARIIFYSKARVKPSDLSSYEALADPKWKGRICVRSGSHDYNLALFGQFFASFGDDKARKVITGIADNLARAPKGNDREQAKAIFEGKCDLALMNTYYHPMMAANPDQKAWADSVGVYFPSQAGKGTFIMRSAVGLTKASENRDLGLQLMEFLASREGQQKMVDATKQYAVHRDVPVHPLMVKLGAEQGLVDGKFRMDFVPLVAMAGRRDQVIKLVNEIGFDSGQ
ncbi:extracellular solute-binding protein [Ideonella sp. A 288]|uniref:extracellular solute-binding protein n=1 Tax=Ideonella sp. A 288 TaxID=1962181 RepID=UPI00130302E8|nr:extracellular solute-binding protein [Ideonella sp. A 288]